MSNTHAAIYARVSSTAQTQRGDGLRSQTTRCREYAATRGYRIEAVFQDDLSGSLIQRPGMQALLAWLRKHRALGPVVIIDDISRLARSLEAHLQLRAAIQNAGGRLESPSVEFGEDSDSVLVENLLASVSQHQRQKNAEQVKNRMRARLMNGYWVFQAPLGFRYRPLPGHGKTLVRDEPLASVLQEALEGFASGRFGTLADVRRFLESHPEFPADFPNGEIRQMRVTRLLENPLYAGMVAAPKWNVPLCIGHHEGLVSFETFTRIQERLQEKPLVVVRQDTRLDFPLRGAVSCAECGNPLTAGWSKGKYRRYAYYHCHTRGCGSRGKSIPRDRLEGDFTALLESATPSAELHALFKAMFRKLWDQRAMQEEGRRKALAEKLKELENQIAATLDRLVETTNKSVASAFDKRLAALDREKLLLAERLASARPDRTTFGQMFELSLRFLGNPLELWRSGRWEDRQTVLKLTFAKRLEYCRESGFRTPVKAAPFKALEGFSEHEKVMVRFDEKTLNTLFRELADWEHQLRHLPPPESEQDDAA